MKVERERGEEYADLSGWPKGGPREIVMAGGMAGDVTWEWFKVGPWEFYAVEGTAEVIEKALKEAGYV